MRVDRDFVASCYELFLGREVEDGSVVAERSRWTAGEVVASIAGSDECRHAVRAPVARGAALPAHLFPGTPSVRQRYWAADRLPLLDATISAIARAPDWSALLGALFSDPLLIGIADGHADALHAAPHAHLRPAPRVWRIGEWEPFAAMLRAYLAPTLAGFESLGDNCELGSLQALAGIDRAGLFRWSAVMMPVMAALLDDDLKGIDDPRHLSVRRVVRACGTAELMLDHALLQAESHTFAAGEIDESELIRQEARRLALLRRKFLEDVRAADRIFVYRRAFEVGEGDVMRLYRSLRRHGPNRLLFVRLADETLGAGEVRLLAPGLAEGALDVLALGMERHSELWAPLLLRARGLLDPARIESEAA